MVQISTLLWLDFFGMNPCGDVSYRLLEISQLTYIQPCQGIGFPKELLTSLQQHSRDLSVSSSATVGDCVFVYFMACPYHPLQGYSSLLRN